MTLVILEKRRKRTSAESRLPTEPDRTLLLLNSAALRGREITEILGLVQCHRVFAKRGLIISTVFMSVVTSLLGCRRVNPSSLSRITIDGVRSYYTYSNTEPGSREGLHVIIFIGHPAGRPERLQRFVGRFSKPVLLIWCGLLSDLDDDALVDDNTIWHKKKQDFLVSFKGYKEYFPFDEKRVYLTGLSSAGVYAWMLAYDRPDLYAGVVAMSALSYPEQIQQSLESAASVVTVVVRGEKDLAFPQRLAQERHTGKVIESQNPHSKFVLKQGEGHGSVAKYWLEYLNYILQFNRRAIHNPEGRGRRRGRIFPSASTFHIRRTIPTTSVASHGRSSRRVLSPFVTTAKRFDSQDLRWQMTL